MCQFGWPELHFAEFPSLYASAELGRRRLLVRFGGQSWSSSHVISRTWKVRAVAFTAHCCFSALLGGWDSIRACRAPPRPASSFGFPDCWTSCVLGSVTKNASFSCGIPFIRVGGGEWLTQLPVQSCGFQLTLMGSTSFSLSPTLQPSSLP